MPEIAWAEHEGQKHTGSSIQEAPCVLVCEQVLGRLKLGNLRTASKQSSQTELFGVKSGPGRMVWGRKSGWRGCLGTLGQEPAKRAVARSCATGLRFDPVGRREPLKVIGQGSDGNQGGPL